MHAQRGLYFESGLFPKYRPHVSEISRLTVTVLEVLEWCLHIRKIPGLLPIIVLCFFKLSVLISRRWYYDQNMERLGPRKQVWKTRSLGRRRTPCIWSTRTPCKWATETSSMWKLSARFVASNIAPSKLEGLSALNNTFRVVSESYLIIS